MIDYELLVINGQKIPALFCSAVIVGAGCAGLNAADSLYDLGLRDFVLLSDGLMSGTSRNTGSDKQTFYKLGYEDSAIKMAQDLFKGGGIHGDHALIEAATSSRNFYKLVNLQVPFPHDKHGLYVGYKTDHDDSQRATSAGPLTSNYMTKALYKSVEGKGVILIDGMQLAKLLVKDQRVYGLLALTKEGFKAVFSPNVILATGGPAGIYRDSVYPPSQIGATGLALEAGCKGVNLSEWQYGIASTKFRWNLSGTYQQVVPSYISSDQDGSNPRNFILDHFSSKAKAIDAIFLKGYEWPFDANKLNKEGSSNIDLLIYDEIYKKGRRVWLDYRKNICIDWFDHIGKIGKNYLENCQINKEDALNRPLDRLKKMNPDAYSLYKNNGIDLEEEMLEIALCAQHNNGGLQVDTNWQTNIEGLFAIGEAAGIYGVYRPGGSALNSTQTGALRAATYISAKRSKLRVNHHLVKEQIEEVLKLEENFLKEKETKQSPQEIDLRAKTRMSYKAGAIRDLSSLKEGIKEAEEDLELLKSRGQGKIEDMSAFFYTYSNLICQITYMSAMIEYIESGGKSRGSYLIKEALGDKDFMDKALVTEYRNGDCINYWTDLRPIPETNLWFENVWREYREGNLFD